MEMVEKIATATKQLQKNVNQAKQKIAAQQVQMDQKQKALNEKVVTLPSKQEKIIKQTIGDVYVYIELLFLNSNLDIFFVLLISEMRKLKLLSRILRRSTTYLT